MESGIMSDKLNSISNELLNKNLKACSNEECYEVIKEYVARLEALREREDNYLQSKLGKKLYYISAEFLIGKLMSNNLINLGVYDEVRTELETAGKELAQIEEIESEASLGNGGLGRLAACFLDSIANLGLNGDGVGLNYHLGLFRQVFENGRQKEVPDYWIGKDSWLIPTDVSYKIDFADFSVTSRMYDINVYGEKTTNKLHLFDIDTVNEAIVNKAGIDFDKEDIKENLTLFLYPDDSDEKGRMLRIYQQYFMVSNAARLILDECRAKCEQLNAALTDKERKSYRNLSELAVIQINDTHPTMIIPELIRLLTENGDIDGTAISMDEAIKIVSASCAYTNHTILAEALEKWPVKYLEKCVPQLMPVIRELDKRVRERYDDSSVYIIEERDDDSRGLVHMAHIDIHYGMSVNGVAKLHTQILKNTELNNFYKLYPDKHIKQCIVNGLQYEDELFCEADGNWKDIRKGSTNGKNLCAWCHGAGGILLSRISLLGNIDNETDEIVKEDIRNAVKTMQSHKYLQNPCVCHGIAGNAEILLTYGQQFQDQIASSTAKHFYSRLVGSVNSGTFECSRPYLYGFNIPGFMTGLAGIGYSLLRLLDPTLPSVLQINI